MRAKEPIFNVPAAVPVAIVVLVAIKAVLVWLGENEGARLKLLLSFLPVRYTAPPARGDWPAAPIWSFVSHQFVHGDWTHLAMNCVWLLAFGGAVAGRIGSLRFLALGLASGIAGAAAFLAVRWGQPVPMVGASGAVSGLMGGAFRFFFNHATARAYGIDDPSLVPRMSLREALTDRRVLSTIGLFIVLNIITAALGFLIAAGGIAWEAHLGGFAFGFLAFALFDRQRRPETQWDATPETGRPTIH